MNSHLEFNGEIHSITMGFFCARDNNDIFWNILLGYGVWVDTKMLKRHFAVRVSGVGGLDSKKGSKQGSNIKIYGHFNLFFKLSNL